MKDKGKRGGGEKEREREFFGEKPVESRAVSKARLPKQSEQLFSSFL